MTGPTGRTVRAPLIANGDELAERVPNWRGSWDPLGRTISSVAVVHQFRGDAMLVTDAMTHRAETIHPDETLQVAARKMRELGVGALVVREGDTVMGILTDRDIVVRSVAEGRSPAEADVRSAMTPQVIDCREDEELEGAVTRMEREAVRRLVVLDAARRLVGMLSVDDVALHSPALAGEIIEHVREPERPIQRGPWPWWEEPAR